MKSCSRLAWLLAGAAVLLPTACHSRPPQPAQATATARPAARCQVGTNLNGITDWNSDLPFVDLFKSSRLWISQRQGAGWGQGPPLALDERGYVRRLEPGCYAETLMLTDQGSHKPTGTYTILYAGRGRLTLNGPRVLSEAPGRMTVEVTAATPGFFLRLMETDPADPIRDIRVILPGFEDSYQAEPFHPLFLTRLRGLACLRFMDWMDTNNSTIATWADRPKLDDATWTVRGVPLEIMVDLANRLRADAWFCIPHLADDDYVRRFASYLKDRLDPKLRIYIEYSNELWNGQFGQSRWAGQQGQAKGFGQQPWEAGWRFTAWRSVQIFDAFEEVFGGRERLVRVLPSQAANAYVSRQILGFQEAGRHADALAIAPYVGLNVPAQGEGLTADKVADWSVGQVLDTLQNEQLPRVCGWLKEHKAVADSYGLELLAYEGGQHLVGVRGGENNEALTRLFIAANRHPRMGELYRQYFDAWEEVGGGLFCYFTSTSRSSKWGSWGWMEAWDDDPARSPKYLAVMDWARRCGQPVGD